MIIFDLDGTLADCEHRRHFVQKDKRHLGCLCQPVNRICNKCQNWKPDYKAFYDACDQDLPINYTINLLRCLWMMQGEEIEIWSGRCESVKNKTMEWITGYIFGDREICPIRMRPIGHSTPDEVLKERWLDEVIASGKKIDYVFDDRPKVIRMWQRRGVYVFNCCQHDQEF